MSGTELRAVNTTHLLGKWSAKAGVIHDRIPFLRKVPKRSVGIILLLILINAIVWIVAGIILVLMRHFSSTQMHKEDDLTL
jgi:hypothetical protein